MLEQLSVMAETGRILHGVHYIVNNSDSGQTEICLRLAACLSEGLSSPVALPGFPGWLHTLTYRNLE